MKISDYSRAYQNYIKPMIYRATCVSDLEWAEISARMLTDLMDHDSEVSYPEDESLYQAMIGRIDEMHNLLVDFSLTEERRKDRDRS